MSTTDTAAQRPRDVEYTLEVIDEDLPTRAERNSPLKDQLAAIKANEEFHGKWVRIASYAQGTAATAAANILRQRHGKTAKATGWTFATRRIDEGERTGLFAKHTPAAVEEGAYDREMEEMRKATAERSARMKAARDKAGAEKAKGGSGGQPKGETKTRAEKTTVDVEADRRSKTHEDRKTA